MSTARLSLHTALFAAFSTLFTGCIGDDAIVFVDPSISAPQAGITGSVLGSTVTGSFQLRLVLGPRASGSSSVTFGAVNITDDAGKTALVSSLSLTTSKPFPLDVPPSSDITIDVTFDLADKTVPQATVDALCAAPGITISGTIQDSLQNAATPFMSESFIPSGCP
ncbi:MAG TPA: hypothetical protein PKA58_11575 [Polyangium sp.]|nr:hypothetical protein [Polyangium sp.]